MRQKTVGELLADERKKAGLSVVALAEKTHIQVSQLTALEANNFSELPPAPFVKAFITQYAAVCGIEAHPFIGLLRRDYKESAKGTLVPREFLSPLLERRAQLKPVRLLSLVLGGVFVALIGYAIVQWYALQQPPLLSLKTPAELARVGQSVVLQGMTEPDVTLTVNAAPIALQADGSFSTTLDFTTRGVQLFTLVATDSRGKVQQLERHVVVEF